MSYRSQSPGRYDRRDPYRRERDRDYRRDYRDYDRRYDRRDYHEYRRDSYDRRDDYSRRDDYKRRDDYRDDRYGRRSPSRYERSRGFRTYGSRADREMYKDSGCLFVGNIPFDYGSKDIEDLFSSVGPVQAVTIGEDKKTGRSKGHAFVQYQKAEDAIKAYEKFNNYQIENRSLRLDWDPGLQNKRDHLNMRPPRYHGGYEHEKRSYDERSSHDSSPPPAHWDNVRESEDGHPHRHHDRGEASPPPSMSSPTSSPSEQHNINNNNNNNNHHDDRTFQTEHERNDISEPPSDEQH